MKTEILPQLYSKIRYIFLVLLFPPPIFFSMLSRKLLKESCVVHADRSTFTHTSKRTSLQKLMVFIKPPSEAKAARATFFGEGPVGVHGLVDYSPPPIGLVSITLAKLWPSARIVALEPAPSSFRYLLWNLRENNVTSQAHSVNRG